MHFKSNVELKRELDEITYDVHKLKTELIDPVPEHFSKADVLRGFFGALFLGFSFLFASNLIKVTLALTPLNMIMIMLSTVVILNAEIYFIGYSRVKNKRERKYGQFVIKRLIAFYSIAIIVSFYLATIYGLVYFLGSFSNLVKMSIIMAMPCAIGAAFTDLLKKY